MFTASSSKALAKIRLAETSVAEAAQRYSLLPFGAWLCLKWKDRGQVWHGGYAISDTLPSDYDAARSRIPDNTRTV
jgi:hypothetical protein